MHPLSHRLFSALPSSWSAVAARWRYGRQIRHGGFTSPEPEFRAVSEFVREGDWVIDVGANVGHYTKAFSDAVGPSGRVIAIEPIPRTFEFLATNSLRFRHSNVTLINAAASDQPMLVSMEIPVDVGGENFYQARIVGSAVQGLQVLAIRIDSLGIPRRVSLVKVDAEGHEGMVLMGMERLLRRDRPILILEGGARQAEGLLRELAYESTNLPGSPNSIYRISATASS